eukprot:GHVH01010972.1.p1 GENE.GHVH01010972.1~~GHVH01010972.1.p1  ORF type:complete len:627 (-),score=75.07 GHVH01010972.1:67-1947(-)
MSHSFREGMDAEIMMESSSDNEVTVISSLVPDDTATHYDDDVSSENPLDGLNKSNRLGCLEEEECEEGGCRTLEDTDRCVDDETTPTPRTKKSISDTIIMSPSSSEQSASIQPISINSCVGDDATLTLNDLDSDVPHDEHHNGLNHRVVTSPSIEHKVSHHKVKAAAAGASSSSNDDRNTRWNADFRIIQPFGKINGTEWQTPGIYPGATPKPQSSMTAFCVNESIIGGRREDDCEDGKIVCIGRKRKKDDAIFRLEMYHKVGGAQIHYRDIKDAFAGGNMCFLTSKVVCYTSWNVTTGSPLIRLFDSEKSELGPSLHTQNFLRKRTSTKFPGGFFQNFKCVIPFIVDESPVDTTDLVLNPHVLAWSREGLICVWDLTCVYVDTQTGRLRYKTDHKHAIRGRSDRPVAGRKTGNARPTDAGTLRRLEIFPKDILEDKECSAVRNRILGVTISQCGTKIYVVDRYWRLWTWSWQTNKFDCIGLSEKLKAISPLKGAPSKPNSTFRNGKKNSKLSKTESTSVKDSKPLDHNKGDQGSSWKHIQKCDWPIVPKQLNLVYADASDYLIISPKVGHSDEEKLKVEGSIEPSGTLWPPSWKDCDWLISIDLVSQEIVEVSRLSGSIFTPFFI